MRYLLMGALALTHWAVFLFGNGFALGRHTRPVGDLESQHELARSCATLGCASLALAAGVGFVGWWVYGR